MTGKYDKAKTLFVTDLDGTLFNMDARLTPYTAGILRCLAQEGYSFTVATARMRHSVQRIFGDCDLPLRLPLILKNGALLYDTAKDKYIKVHTVPEDSAVRLIQLACESGFAVRIETIDDGGIEVTQSGYQKLDNTFGLSDRLLYCTFSGGYEDLRRIIDAAAGIPGITGIFSHDDYTPDGWFAEFFSEEASKGIGVRFLRTSYGFDYVVGFGDNLNDIPLFAECDESYAPESAVTEVKAAATSAIGRNDEDAVARWFAENVLR